MGLLELVLHSVDSTSIMLAGIALIISLKWLRSGPRFPSKPPLPPGLYSWPIVGDTPYFAICKKEIPEAFWNISKRLGPVFCVRFGAARAVVLNDYRSIREAMTHPDLQGRPSSLVDPGKVKAMIDEKEEGVRMVSGEAWRLHRKFMSDTFRRFGAGKSRFEDAVAMETGAMMAAIREEKQSPFDPEIVLSNAISNIICSMTLGRRFEYTDPEFQRLLNLIPRQLELFSNAGIVSAFPILRKIGFGSFNEIKRNGLELLKLFHAVIGDHHDELDAENIGDVIDAYRAEIKSAEITGSPDPEVFNEKNLVAMVSELFLLGVEPVVTTLRWVLLYLVAHPDVQVKVQEELDDVIGRGKMPRWEDRGRLPYVEATIAEVQRIGSVTALGGWYTASKEVQLFGYTIPKGVWIVPNLYAVLRSPYLWDGPFEFRPERFLDADGKFTRPDHLIPFGAGTRQCPGEQLAKMELFILLSHLLHTFTFSMSGNSAPPTEGKMGASFKPLPFKVTAEERVHTT